VGTAVDPGEGNLEIAVRVGKEDLFGRGAAWNTAPARPGSPAAQSSRQSASTTLS